MSDIIAAIIVIVVVGAAVAYIVKQKRQGVKCIGCAVGKDACAHAAAAAYASEGCGCGAVDGMVERMNEAAGCCCEGVKRQH